MKKITGIILQIFGVLFILCACLLLYMFLTMSWTEENIKNANQVNGYLIRAGLSKEQPIKVISGYAFYHPFMNDYVKDWCVQIEEFEISYPYLNYWQEGENVHPIIHRLKKTELSDVAGKCFDSPIYENTDLKFFVLDVRTSIRKNKFQFDQLFGFEAMIYDPKTQRIAFYGHQI